VKNALLIFPFEYIVFLVGIIW